jgi:hypothetical protein
MTSLAAMRLKKSALVTVGKKRIRELTSAIDRS